MENTVFRLRIENSENKSVWVEFPCNAESFKSILTQAGFSKEDMTNFKITGFAAVVPEYKNLSDFLQLREVENTDGYIIRENIDELNYLAIRLSYLSEPDITAFCAALEAGEHNRNIKELINLAHNTGYYKVIADISDWSDYGKHIALQDGFNTGNIGSIVNFIDFEKYGRHHADDHGGYLLDDGIFLETGWAEFINVYDGNKMNIPFEHRLVNFGLDKDKKDYIPLLGKSPSIYKDTMLLTSLDEKIHVGCKDNIYTDEQGEHFYNNADNSFTFVSENKKMGALLATLAWGASQNDLKSMGLFTDKDYEEFNKIQTELLTDYTIIQPVSFSGVPFHYPVTEEQQAEKVNKNDVWQRKQIDKPSADLHLKDNNGIISFGTASTNIIVGVNSQTIQTDNQRESEEQNMSDKRKVLVVEPMQKPYIKEIDSDLKSLQNEVGGRIRAIYPFEEEAAIICNEEGKINGLELNRALWDENGKIYDILAGTFLVCGLTSDNFGSLPDELIDKFSKRFEQPETFIQVGRDILAIPTEPRKPSIKEQIQQTKKEQGNRTEQKPRRQTPPELC